MSVISSTAQILDKDVSVRIKNRKDAVARMVKADAAFRGHLGSNHTPIIFFLYRFEVMLMVVVVDDEDKGTFQSLNNTKIHHTFLDGRNPYQPINNPTGMIQMGLAENQLSFDLLESWIHDLGSTEAPGRPKSPFRNGLEVESPGNRGGNVPMRRKRFPLSFQNVSNAFPF
ncbi:hypothetical protein E3N88_07772 [Mikania micrantha]|uniref:Uncharacterized protein n=1 Tax=Mikania micrantha TaxID=192012 RepID=A0A5N6PFF0_9ASTR|nr:hypothetical protein E3N88_07772 [Mikania micrantha]